MLIMMYAHARFSGNGDLLSQHVRCVRFLATVFAHNSPTVLGGETMGRLSRAEDHDSEFGCPVSECVAASTTHSSSNFRGMIDESPGNLTNLALKGIIAIQAMSEISRATGNSEDARAYQVSSCLLLSISDI